MPTKAAFGVVFAAVGNHHFFHETRRSVQELRIASSSQYGVHVFTSWRDAAACSQYRAGNWTCVAIEALTARWATQKEGWADQSSVVQRARENIAVYFRNSAHRNTSVVTKTYSRYIKFVAMMASPYKFSLYFDTDMFPCMSLGAIFTRAGGYRLFDAYDFAIAFNHIGSLTYSVDRRAFNAFDVPDSWSELNSGVVFFAPHRAQVQDVLAEALMIYCSDKYIRTASNRGRVTAPGDHSRSTWVGDQQALSIALYRGARSRNVTVHLLTSIWNFNHFRHNYRNSTSTCCHPGIPIGGGRFFAEIILDSKCNWPRVYRAPRANGTGGLGRPSAGAGPPPRQSVRTRPNLASRSGVGVR